MRRALPVRACGYRSKKPSISIRRDGGSLTVSVSDDGAAFDPLARERHELVFDELDQGGMGLMLVRKVTEDIAYERVDEKNVLTMRFAL